MTTHLTPITPIEGITDFEPTASIITFEMIGTGPADRKATFRSVTKNAAGEILEDSLDALSDQAAVLAAEVVAGFVSAINYDPESVSIHCKQAPLPAQQ